MVTGTPVDTEPDDAVMLFKHGPVRVSDPCERREPIKFQALLEFRGDGAHFSTTRLAFSFAVLHLWERVPLSARPMRGEGKWVFGL